MLAIRNLFHSISQFFTGFTLIFLLGFVTFPVLTRLLSREEYGILGLVTTTMGIAVAIAKGGISDGIIRYYGEYATTPERLSVFTSTVLTRGALLVVVVVGAYIVSIPYINALIGVSPRYLSCFLVMALYLFVRPLDIIVGNYLRSVGKIFFFNAVNVSTKVLEIAFGFTLLLWLVRELYGYLLGVALAEVCAMVILYRWLFKNYRFAFSQVSGSLARDLVKFGLPLMFTELAYLFLSYTDRYMIIAFHGEDMLGLYSVGYNVPSYVNNLVMFSISYAVVPIYTDLYRREGKAATEEFLTRAFRYSLIGAIPLCVGYAAIAHDALVTLASEKYAEAAGFSPIILAGLIFLGLNYILYAGLYLEKKSGQILAAMLFAVVINVSANLILLPRYGATGAAISTLLACLASSALMAVLGRRYLRIEIPISTLLYYLAASAAMYFILAEIETSRPWLNLVTKIPAGALIMAVAMIAREHEIRAHAWKLIRGASGKIT